MRDLRQLVSLSQTPQARALGAFRKGFIFQPHWEFTIPIFLPRAIRGRVKAGRGTPISLLPFVTFRGCYIKERKDESGVALSSARLLQSNRAYYLRFLPCVCIVQNESGRALGTPTERTTFGRGHRRPALRKAETRGEEKRWNLHPISLLPPPPSCIWNHLFARTEDPN